MDVDAFNLYIPKHLFEIKPMKRGATMMQAVGFDSETIHGAPMTLQFTSGPYQRVFWVNDKTAEKTFFQALDVICMHKGITYVLFGHNLKFDTLSFLPQHAKMLAGGYFELKSSEWLVQGVYGAPTWLRFKKGPHKRAILVDTAGFTIGRQRLSTIAEFVCPALPKLEMPHGLGDKQFKDSDSKFMEYALRDAVIAETFGQTILEWHRAYDIPMSLTGSNMAAQVYKKHYVNDHVFLPPLPVCWNALRSYHGGINRAPHGVGYWENVTALDIVSAYPHAMTQLPSFTNPKAYKPFKRTQLGKGRVPDDGIYKLHASMKLTPYPIIFGKRFENIPMGEFETWTTGYEINCAQQHGQIRDVYVEGTYYDRDLDTKPSAMKAYCEHFFESKAKAKVSGNKTQEAADKLLLNGLYGKMIQTRPEVEVYYDFVSNTMVEDISLRAGGLFNPFIASLITAHCRARVCHLEHTHVSLHTATDGIITPDRSTGNDSNRALGGITVEAKGDALILRPKLYIIYSRSKKSQEHGNASVVRKGWNVEKYALHGFRGKLEDLERMLASGTNNYKYTHVVGLKESLRSKQGWRANDFIERTGKLDLDVVYGQMNLQLD